MTDPRLAGLSPQDRALLFARLRERKKAAADPASRDLPAPRPRQADPPPLSFAQQRLWFLDRLVPGNAAYNIPLALRVSGPLDAAGLRRALAQVVARQESLRTTFRVAGSEPVQVIAPVASSESQDASALPLVDLSGLGARAEPEAVRLHGEESLRPFDLAAGPLLRVALLRLAAGEHVLTLNLHHIISDGWSNGVLVRELTTAYGGGSLPELPIQYADFAVWQRRWLAGDVLEAQIAFWRQRLAGMPAAFDLPADRPRPPVRGSRGAQVELGLGLEMSARLKEMARRAGTTPFAVLLAAFQTVLFRWTEQSDVAVGAPVANRSRTEVAGLIGFFVNTLVMRSDLSGDPEFGELVGQVRQASLDAFEHQDLPFEKLVEELRPQRDPSRPPLVQVQLVLQNTPAAALTVSGLRIEVMDFAARTAKLDLSLSLGELGGRFFGSLTYSTDLFDASTMRRLAGHLTVLIAAACADPQLRLSSLPLLAAAEQAQALREWNDTGSPGPEPESVPVLFARCAALFPDRPAVLCGEEVLTYRELAQWVERLARELRRRGIGDAGPEARVALAAGRSPAMVAGLLAVLAAGGAYVPLDPALPAGRWAELLDLAAPAVVLAEEQLLDRLPAGTVPVVLRAEGEMSDDTAPGLPAPLPESAAYVLFTSGSTGTPKGVVVEHRQLSHYVGAVTARLGLPAGEEIHYGLVSTFAADLGHTVLFPALCSGGCLHVVAADTALDPEAFSRSMERHPIDVLKIVPSHLAGLLQASRPAAVLPRRLLVLGGEAASWELVDRVEELAPGCAVWNHYGPTETTVGAVAQPLTSGAEPRPRRPRRPPLGRPLRNVEAYVLDPRLLPVAAGVPGELWLGGDGLARGYLARPELTAERFTPHPFSSQRGRRLYRTGDRVRRLADGALEFLGRMDRQVKIRGYRVEPGEIEAALARHPAVAACAVVVQGEEGGAAAGLTAYVAFHDPQAGAVTPQDLRQWLAGLLPAAMVPAAWVVLDALPLTPNGKLDRQALAQAAPEPARGEPLGAPPRTAVERELAALWSEVLGVERVGIADSFFDLGGHSLLLPRLQAGLRERMGREVPLLKLFEHPTIETLAAWLEDGAEEGLDSGASRDRMRRQRQGLEQQRQRLAQRKTP